MLLIKPFILKNRHAKQAQHKPTVAHGDDALEEGGHDDGGHGDGHGGEVRLHVCIAVVGVVML